MADGATAEASEGWLAGEGGGGGLGGRHAAEWLSLAGFQTHYVSGKVADVCVVSTSTVNYAGLVGEHLRTPSFVAYYGLLQVQARTVEVIARELEARTGLPASWYEVLACLEREPGGQRMNELADDLLISRGGATKLVARLEEAELVERFTPKSDRRATYAKLTARGAGAVMAAHPIQLELTERHFGRFLSPEELDQVVAMSTKVLSGLGATSRWLDAATGGAQRPAT